MIADEINVLLSWILHESEFKRNDLLVDLQHSKIIPFSETVALNDIEKILSKSQQSTKESGINPFCTVRGVLNWEYKNTECATPIWIIPSHFKIDRVRKTVLVAPNEEEKIINPFLSKQLEEKFGISLSANAAKSVFDQLTNAGFTSIDTASSWIGNFHHHRYAIVKDLEEIANQKNLSPALLHYISGARPQLETFELPKTAILPYDTDHRAVFEQIETENCVVQGPPGTGKSQLLTNIAAKALLAEKSLIFVSEKRSALEVIEKRLTPFNLHQFAVIATDDLTSNAFVDSLKKSWEFIENTDSNVKKEQSVRPEMEANLQFTIDLLNQPTLIGETNFTHFQELKSTIDIRNFTFLSKLPSMPAYEQNLDLVDFIYSNSIETAIPLVSIQQFQEDLLEGIARKLEVLENALVPLEKIKPKITPVDFDTIRAQQINLHIFETEIAKRHGSILRPDSKEQKQFIKLYKQLQKTNVEETSSSDCLTEWKRVPSNHELIEIEVKLHQNGLIQKLKWSKKWKTINYLDRSQANESIQRLKKHYHQIEKIAQLKAQLLLLGINSENEATILHTSIGLFTKEKWETYLHLNTNEKEIVAHLNQHIEAFYHACKNTFDLQPNTPVSTQIETIKKAIPLFVANKNLLKNLTKEIQYSIEKSDTFLRYKQNILGTTQSIFSAHYPSFSQFNISDLTNKISALTTAEQKEHSIMAQTIIQKAKITFDQNNAQIAQQTNGLSVAQKLHRKRLKNGKSILIKEFNKTRQHLSIRQLLASDAVLWIQLLKPLWLTNPVQLAKTHPIDCDPFSICIMDEASQIPLSHAVGALQRSKRILIAGDDKQMNPTAYFQANGGETTSVLQHAKYQFSNKILTHHYRSKHAPLIAFSNAHFYENSLRVYPSFPINEQCIRGHFCSDGSYVDRVNVVEALKVIELLKNAFQKNKTIGIVAFSQEQIACIWNNMPFEMQQQLQIRIYNNTCFLKPLEKVQGDECDNLIVSMAFGKNENEVIHQRFGPLTHASGQNRLNVLFSRASEQIDFVYSIHSEQLKWSENPSIHLLYLWIKQLEMEEKTKETSLPPHFMYTENTNQLTLKNCFQTYTNALELKTVYTVLNERGWNVQFV